MNGETLIWWTVLLLATLYAWRWLRPRQPEPFIDEPRVPTNAERIRAWHQKGGPRLWRDAILNELSTLPKSASGKSPLPTTLPQARGALSVALNSKR